MIHESSGWWRHHLCDQDNYNRLQVFSHSHRINFLVLLVENCLIKFNSITFGSKRIYYFGSDVYYLLLCGKGLTAIDLVLPHFLNFCLDLIRWVNATFVHFFDCLPLNISLTTRGLCTSCSHFLK